MDDEVFSRLHDAHRAEEEAGSSSNSTLVNSSRDEGGWMTRLFFWCRYSSQDKQSEEHAIEKTPDI